MMLHLRATYFRDKYRKTVAAIRRKKHCNCSVAARAAMPRKTEDNAANTAAPTKPKRQGRNKTQAAMPRTQRQCHNKTKAAMPQQNQSGNAADKKKQGGNAASTCACSIVVRYSITATEDMFLFICVPCRRCVHVTRMRTPSSRKPRFISSPKLLRHRQLVPAAFHVLAASFVPLSRVHVCLCRGREERLVLLR